MKTRGFTALPFQRTCRVAARPIGILSSFLLLCVTSPPISIHAQPSPGPELAGYSLQLNGTSQFAAIPHHDAFNALPLTFTAWIKSTQTSGYKLVCALRGGYRLALQDGRAYAGYTQPDIANSLNLLEPELLAADGSWHHLALVVGTNGGSLYMDGNLRLSRAWSSTPVYPPSTSEAFLLGGNPVNTATFFQGLLDEATLWNRELGATELRSLMYRQLEGAEPGLVAAWRMDEEDGSILIDSGPNRANGYTTNAPVRVQSCIPAARGALKFSGEADSLRVSGFGTAAPTDQVTVEFWAKVESPGKLFCLSTGSATNNLSAELLPRGDLRWQFGDSTAGGVLQYGPLTTVTGAWTHFAFVGSKSGNYMRVYRNGELEAAGSSTSSLIQHPADLVIGGGVSRIGEFRVWSEARTQELIREHLHRRIAAPAPALLLYFCLDERAGSRVNNQGMSGTGGVLSACTTWISFPVEFAPLAITLAPTGVTPTLATLNASINPNGLLTTAWFEWGPQRERTTAQFDVSQGSEAFPLRESLATLSPSETYFYRVGASNRAGVSFGPTAWFIASLPPTVETLPANNVSAQFGETTALLHGLVQPNFGPTTAWFAWGPNILCQNTTAPVFVGTNPNQVEVSALLEHITAESIFHFRMVASNTCGTVVGPDQTFWAPGIRLNGEPLMVIREGTEFDDPGAAVMRPIISLSGGSYHCLALTYDGRVIAWGAGLFSGGFPNHGQSIVPAGLDQVVAIAAGGAHSLALRRDGRVVAWGSNSHRVCQVPADLTNAVAIGAGFNWSLAATSDGTYAGWGSPLVLSGHWDYPELHDVVGVDAGTDLLVFLRRNGTLDYWSYDPWTPPWPLTNVVAIDVNNYSTMALQMNGVVALFGNGARAPAGLSNIIGIANAPSHYLALRQDGSVAGWNGDGAPLRVPPELSNVAAVAATYHTNFALHFDGRVTQWEDAYGASGVSVTNLAPLARPVAISGAVDTTVPGIYTVRYTAENPWGITGQAFRTVVVEPGMSPSPWELGSIVLAQLTDLHRDPRHPEVRKLLRKSLESIRDSLAARNWADQWHLHPRWAPRVFDDTATAVVNLQVLLANPSAEVPLRSLRDMLADLLRADRLLAVRALEDRLHGGWDLGAANDVWDLILEGDQAAAKGDLESALSNYQTAWAQAAVDAGAERQA